MARKTAPKNLPAQRPKMSAKPPVLERLEPAYPPVRRLWDRNRIIVWGALLVIAGQVFAPEDYKPFRLAGEAAASFHGALFDEVNRKELELAQQRAIAEKMAELQADYANWKGLCSLTGAFDPSLGAACMRGADAHYESALKKIRDSELLYR